MVTWIPGNRACPEYTIDQLLRFHRMTLDEMLDDGVGVGYLHHAYDCWACSHIDRLLATIEFGPSTIEDDHESEFVIVPWTVN